MEVNTGLSIASTETTFPQITTGRVETNGRLLTTKLDYLTKNTDVSQNPAAQYASGNYTNLDE